MDHQSELLQITATYFEEPIQYDQLFAASKAYRGLLHRLCSQELDSDEGRQDIQLSNGKAIGALWAAMCIDDMIRTRQFIRGIDKAIKNKMQDQAPIHLLYAGTGPFAPLLLPLVLRHSKRIKYTFIEINTLAFAALREVISKLQLTDYDITLLREDATTYQITGTPPDIIVSETMQNALAKEPQVPIYFNLMQQVDKKTLFIPERIQVFLGLRTKNIPLAELSKEHYQRVSKVLDINADHLPKATEDLQSYFKPRATTIGKEALDRSDQLVFLTDIQVYDNERIGINESGLTTPLILDYFSNRQADRLTVSTQYQLGPEPVLTWQTVFEECVGE